MTKEDFKGIETGDKILIDDKYCEFRSIDNQHILVVGFDCVFLELSEIKSLSVLTGKLASWSSPWVPDWAKVCIQDAGDGAVKFFESEPVWSKTNPRHTVYIITKRPSWCKPKGNRDDN